MEEASWQNVVEAQGNQISQVITTLVKPPSPPYNEADNAYECYTSKDLPTQIFNGF